VIVVDMAEDRSLDPATIADNVAKGVPQVIVKGLWWTTVDEYELTLRRTTKLKQQAVAKLRLHDVQSEHNPPPPEPTSLQPSETRA
jgi:hypothetical protein